MKSCFLLAFLAGSLVAQQSTRYELRFPNAVHHEAEVTTVFTGVSTFSLDVLMSRSSPGRYALHEFAKNIYHVRASDGANHPLPLIQLSPSAWRVTPKGSTVVFEYTLFGDRADGTYDGIDETHAHLNMPATLVWAPGYEHVPSTLQFFPPVNSGWKVATQLIPHDDGTWSAPDLEWLMDSPAELSAHSLHEWKAEDATFRLALHHTGTEEMSAKYARMCEAVVLEEEGVFGRFPKYDGGTYTFLVDYFPYASGDGMEHRDSSVITDTGELSRNAERMIGTVSHEFFHSWNVKRIRPRTLEPFDFERANMSGELWFAEGFTNYYGILALHRAGLSDLSAFAHNMGGAVNAVLTAPGRKVHSAVEMSRLAPFVDAAASIDPNNFGNTYISYYIYGQALALGIDLSIRQRFPGKSLDDWMRLMWREHPDIEKPYTLADLQSSLAEVTGDERYAREIFEHHIEGRESLDYAALLAPAGMLLRPAHAGQPWWGKAILAPTDAGLQITTETSSGTPLYDAGLEQGDTILEIAGKRTPSTGDPSELLKGHKPGDRVHLKVRTRAGEKAVEVTIAEDPQREIVSFEDAGRPLTPEIKAFRHAWLDSKALHPLPPSEAR